MKDKRLYGNKIATVLYKELKEYTKSKKTLPKLVDISIGNDFGGQIYAELKKKRITKYVGFEFESLHYDSISFEELIKVINKLNNDKNVSGIMIQLPLSKELQPREREILDTISPLKDVDGLTTTSLGKLFVGKYSFVSCVAKGIIILLKIYGISLNGKNVCIINRSNLLGKPLEQLLLKENATTTICHSKTENLKSITSRSDIIIAALNKKEYIKKEYVKKGAIVIDVGVHKNNNGEIVGDVDFKNVYDKVKFITPPTGSIGVMTTCMLAYNTAYSYYGEEIILLLDKAIEKAKLKI